MHRLLNFLAVLSLANAEAGSAGADPAASIPSYREALDAFQAERAKAGGPAINDADRQVMDRAAQDLARAMPDPGLKVGDKAPDFTLPNAFGQPVHLQEMLVEGPVVLTFYRGGWCPYCNLQLRGLRDTLPYFEQQGARLVAVTPQKPDKSREQVESDGYPFEILSDLDDRVMQAYKLLFQVPADLSQIYKQRLSLDLAEYNGDGRYVLPVPATFVIDRSGVIRAAFVDVDYRKRVEPSAIVSALRQLPAE